MMQYCCIAAHDNAKMAAEERAPIEFKRFLLISEVTEKLNRTKQITTVKRGESNSNKVGRIFINLRKGVETETARF